ncbi:hypothetical protein UFOVP137_18 [uncultured Caudovirales phage]|uniref:Large polyvalent protein associated domain-containing protein n=1 Tax=uncultured Caudovirales phage TaxID=2100421 RepID=A0A6J5LG12_9CAUD|nr:hypothetical protein UFOVP137_18 [uncultured Caudovirales phage]
MDNKYLSIIDDEEQKRQLTQQQSNSTLTSGKPAVGNKYMQILDSEITAKDQAFKFSARSNIDVNPDKAAEQKRQAQFLGAPEGFVQDFPEDAARAAKLKTLNENTQNAPVLRQKYTDADFARIAHDDSGVLSTLENGMSVLGRSIRSMGRFIGDIPAAIYGVGETVTKTVAPLADPLAGTILPENPLRRLAAGLEDFRKKSQAGAQAIQGELPKDAGVLESNLYNASRSFGDQLPGLAATIITRNPAYALGSAGVLQAGESGTSALDKGASPAQALSLAAADATAEVAFEKFGVGKLLKDIGAGSGFGKLLFGQIIREVPSEMATTLVQNFNEWAIVHPDKSMSDFIEELGPAERDTVISTIMQTVMTAGFGSGASFIAKRMQAQEQAKQAENTKQFMEAIVQSAQDSKTLARAPEVFQSFLASTTDGTPAQDLYISASTLMQSGVAEQVAQVLPSVKEQLSDAAASDGYVRIPTAEYVTAMAGNELNQQLVDNIKLDPNGYTFAESQAYQQTFNQEMTNKLEMMMVEKAGDESFKASRDVVREQFLQELNTANRFTSEANQAYASMLASYYAVQAARTGMTTEQFVQKYQLEVVNKAVDIGTFDQGEATVTNKVDQKTGLPLNSDGTVTLYHHTSAENAKAIKESGVLKSASEPSVYLTTRAETDTGYGDTAVKVRIDPSKLQIDDEFPNGRVDYSVDVGKPAGSLVDAKFNQSATIRSGEETLQKYGLEPGKQYNTRDIAQALEARQLEKYGNIARDDRSPEAVDKIADWITEEVKFEMEHPENSGVGWYSEKFQNALNIMGETFPELLTDQNARDVMTALIAITSDGQKVMGNTNQAMDIYSNFRDTGKFTTELGHARMASIDGNLEVLQSLYDEMGAEGMREFLMNEKTVSELKKIAKENGTELKSDYQAIIKMPMAVVALGPKLGAFYANLMGSHGYLTMDRWWSRTFNRYRGGLLTKPTDSSLRSFAELIGKPRMKDDKVLQAILKPQAALEARGFKTRLAEMVGKSEPGKAADKAKWMEQAKKLAGKDFEKLLKEHNIERAANTIYKMAFVNLEDAPFGAKDRTFMLDATNEAQKKLAAQGYNLSIADIQAILWYYEKKLYGELGARSSGKISYEDAARIVVDARNSGLDISELDSTIEDEDSDSAEAGVPLGEEPYAGTLDQSQLDQPARGQISFADDITRQPSVIALLKDADLSTFIHESGHFFLQVQADLASRIEGRIAAGEEVSLGEREIVDDMNKVLTWFGITGTPELSAINTWASMPLEEQRPYHEKWARGFEAYAFEGTAPTMELQSVFQKFSSWLKRVYTEMKALNVELTDEVRGVMDRMLATTEQIQAAEAARSMGPLFNAQNAQGMIEDWKSYHDLGLAATQEGIDILQARGLKDMQWLGNARSRKLKEMQRSVKALRTETMMDARREVMSQPIYRAWQFLTGKIEKDDKITPEGPRRSDPDVVDPQLDSMFTAIAKLGGISKAQVVANWGWDPKERSPVPVFGKPTVRTEGGLSIDAMGQLLEQYGYLTLDENGRYDPAQFEALFDEEARGNAQYSNQVDPTIFVDPLPGSSVILSNMKAARFDLASLMSLGLDDAIVERIKDLKMTAKDGIHPDIVAAEFEFTSGVELAEKIAASPKLGEAIEALTDQMMLQRYGDLVTPEGIERAADQAVHNEARLKFLHTEAKALETAMRVRADTGKTNAKGQKQTYAVLPQAARAFAASIIAKVRVRDLRPSQYSAAEVKAAKEAERAFNKGDLEMAAEQKRNQIINAYTAKEAMAAAGEIQQMVAYFRKFDRRSKGLDPDYYDQIVQMLERFDFVPSTSLKEIDARTSLSKWLDAQREQGIEPDIPPKLELEAYRTSYKNLTVEDMRGLRDTIKQIEHLGRLKMKLINAADARAFALIRQEMVDSIVANAGDRFVSNRQPATLLGEKWLSIKNFFAEHIKAATLGYVLDGGKNGGPVWEYLIRPANLAGDKETVMRAQATRDLSDLIEPVLKQGKLTEKMFIAGLTNAEDLEQGRNGSTWTREQLLTMALNMGNESNMQRLLDGEGWTVEQLNLGLSKLTAADWQFAQQVWDYFESFRPEIAAKERRIYGKEPNWIEPRALSVRTADGQQINLRGGYYPVKYDTRASLRAEQDMSAEDAKRALQSSYIAATTRRSFTKERAQAVMERPLMYTLDGIYRGVNEVIHDLAWHEWVIDSNKILKDPAISSAIRKHYGDYSHKQLTKWVDSNAEGDQGPKNSGEKAAAFVRQGVSVAGLGLNIMSALTQPFGITQSMVRVGAKWVGRGVARMMQNPMALNSEINQMSDFMRTRSMTRMRELAELRNRVKGKSKTKENIDASMYLMMLTAQRMVDLPTWWGAYERAIAEGNDQDRAVDLADQSVIDAQGSGTTKDLSAIERGGPVAKLFTVFYSFMNTALNMGYAKTMTEKSRAKLTMDYMMLYMVPVIMIAAMKDALTPGDSGDWDDLGSILDKLLKEELSFLMGMIVGIRELGPLYDAFMGKPATYQGPAGLRPVNDAIRLAKELGQGEMDDNLRKATVNMAGDIFGLPSAQINRTITGAQALKEGDTKNPAALLFGYQQER